MDRPERPAVERRDDIVADILARLEEINTSQQQMIEKLTRSIDRNATPPGRRAQTNQETGLPAASSFSGSPNIGNSVSTSRNAV